MTIRPAHAHLAAALFLLMATVPATATWWTSEVNALLAWKASLADTAGLSSWTRGFPVCNWTYVSCGLGNRVSMIGIQGRGISGGLGTLDTAALPALRILDLSGNRLGGAIPGSISQLRYLEFLDLSNNTFDGSIPPQLGDMRNLVTLRLYNNNIVGYIPHKLCRLLSVQLLDLSNNRLTGELPDCWCKLQKLKVMDLSNNRLTGELPGCWWNLQSLRFMDLSNNSFYGEIPMGRASHNCNLESLYLARNSISGAFPRVLKRCNSLNTLDIGRNMFSGGIPPWIGSHLVSLRILSLRSNNFTGEIPPELSQLSQLQLLDMANNSLSASIPVAFGNLPAMRDQQSLSTLRPKQVQIPASKYQDRVEIIWKNVQIPVSLDSENKYKDRIEVIWKGQKMIFQRTVWLLTGVDLSGNFLSRCIPEELTNLQGLLFLNLSRNHLCCSIPKDIASLNFLESLDLSSNELSGAIPPSISNISGLSMFNVSNNRLSGKIPTGSHIQTLNDPSIYSNNSGLCGFPLDVVCAYTSSTPDKRNGEWEGHWMDYYVIAGILYGLCLWFGMLFTIEIWRCAFVSFVDGLQCKVMQKLSH